MPAKNIVFCVFQGNRLFAVINHVYLIDGNFFVLGIGALRDFDRQRAGADDFAEHAAAFGLDRVQGGAARNGGQPDPGRQK